MRKIKLIAITLVIAMLLSTSAVFADAIVNVHNWDFHNSYADLKAGLTVFYYPSNSPMASTAGEANPTDNIHVCRTIILSANNQQYFSTSYTVNSYEMHSGLCYGAAGYSALTVTHYLMREFSDGTEFMRKAIYSYN